MIPIVQNSIAETTQISLIRSGSGYFDFFKQIIDEAQSEIHLQTYILEEDQIGTKIIDSLKNAANRGVKIHLLLDGFGSNALSKKIVSELQNHQIHFRFFSPLLSASSFNFSRRLHHKVLVTDKKNILIGGINIANKYNGSEQEQPWLDYAVWVQNHTLAQPLEELCNTLYYRKWLPDNQKMTLHLQNKDIHSISILQNDWLKQKKQIHNSYIKNIQNAKKEIIIMGSYFLPGKKIISALKKASKSKVEIKLILSGISDVALSKKAASYLYNKLLRYDIKIYEWNKSVLHAKTAVIDRNWTTIGSFNLNNLSAYASIEMNVSIDSPEIGNKFAEHMEEIISECNCITVESLKSQKNWHTQIIYWASYWTARILMTITTYLPYKRFLKIS